MSTVAFIGLGNMGGPMAANLVRAGHRVQGFDLDRDALDRAAKAGVSTASSTAETVTGAEIVITMLPTGRHVLDCYGGPGGILATAPPGALLVDCSTIDVADARTAHRAAADSGRQSVDAPVSGGVVGAENATLTFMAGGEETAFARAEPALAAMGRRTVHCGAAGAGQAAKICNNLILGVSMIAVSEAFVLGEALGLAPEALFDVASTASGQCWALTANCPVPGPVPGSPANRDYRPGFSTALMAKDLGLAHDALTAHGVDGRLGAHAARLYAALADGPAADQDFSTVINDIRARSRRSAETPPTPYKDGRS